MDSPEERISKFIKYVVGDSRQGGDGIIFKFLFDVRTQLKPSRLCVVHNQTHFFSHLIVDAKGGSLTMSQCIKRVVIVYHQFAVLHLEFDVGPFSGMI